MLLYLKGVNVTPENPKTQTCDISADLVLVSILWDCVIVRLETDSLLTGAYRSQKINIKARLTYAWRCKSSHVCIHFTFLCHRLMMDTHPSRTLMCCYIRFVMTNIFQVSQFIAKITFC